MSNAGIENRKQHYRSMGWLTTSELAEAVGISKPSIDARFRRGVYDGMWVMATDKTKLFSPEAAKHDLPKGRWGHRHQTER
jgi:DNA-binding XRE family transcriptional regulator